MTMVGQTEEGVERALLGAMLSDTVAVRVASQLLTADDFTRRAHADAFGVMTAMYRDGQVIDELTFCARAEGEGVLAIIGGRDAPSQWMMACPSPASAEDYAHILRRATQRRCLAVLAQRVIKGLHDGARTVDLLATTERAAAAIRARDDERGTLVTLDADAEDEKAGRRFLAPLPWPMLSEDAAPLLSGKITILCGSPGATKSFAALQIIRHCRIMKIAAVILELEDGAAFHVRRGLAQASGCSHVMRADWLRDHAAEYDALRAAADAELQWLESAVCALSATQRPTADSVLSWLQMRGEQGARVMIVDPISLVDWGRDMWVQQTPFVFSASQIAMRYGASIVLVSHPRKRPSNAKGDWSLDDVAGGAAFVRHSQTVLWLASHDSRDVGLATTAGRCTMPCNRTVKALKVRNGSGEHRRYGFWFNGATLSLEERGRICDD